MPLCSALIRVQQEIDTVFPKAVYDLLRIQLFAETLT